VIREKRATFTQSPEQLKRRNGAETMHSNLFLAGDWTATGLPATIEGAVRSGHIAVAKMLSTPGDS
jgi:monoamine oxidase